MSNEHVIDEAAAAVGIAPGALIALMSYQCLSPAAYQRTAAPEAALTFNKSMLASELSRLRRDIDSAQTCCGNRLPGWLRKDLGSARTVTKTATTLPALVRKGYGSEPPARAREGTFRDQHGDKHVIALADPELKRVAGNRAAPALADVEIHNRIWRLTYKIESTFAPAPATRLARICDRVERLFS
jgi:hypothetical protein